MAILRVEYPILGTVSIELPDSVAEDKQLSSELVKEHFTRCSVGLCVMLGFIIAMMFAALLIWINDSIVERRFAHRVTALENQNQQLESSNRELVKRVDTLLSSIVTKDGAKIVEEAKKTIDTQLANDIEAAIQKRLVEFKDRVTLISGKGCPKGVQVAHLASRWEDDLKKLNEFLLSKEISEVVGIQQRDGYVSVIYVPKK